MFFDKEYVIIKRGFYNFIFLVVMVFNIKFVFWWMRGVKKVVIMSVICNF